MAKTKVSRDTKETAAVEPGTDKANINRQVARSESFASLYTNDTQVQLSPWDVRLIFGIIDRPPSADNPTIHVTAVGEVRMSPQHAKRVATILLRQLKTYEETVGPIPQPE
jgi:hypothetical protein